MVQNDLHWILIMKKNQKTKKSTQVKVWLVHNFLVNGQSEDKIVGFMHIWTCSLWEGFYIPKSGSKLAERYFGTLIHLLQLVASPHHHLVKSFDPLSCQVFDPLCSSSFVAKILEYLKSSNEHFGEEGEAIKSTKDTVLWVWCLCVQSCFCAKNNNIQFFHPFLAKWEPW